jgi:hypothetical protein
VLLPPGVTVKRFEDTAIARPPKDTRTVKGVVEQAPLHVYKCAPAACSCCVFHGLLLHDARGAMCEGGHGHSSSRRHRCGVCLRGQRRRCALLHE